MAGEPCLHAALDGFVDMFRWDALPDPAVRRACHAFGVASFHRALPILASGGFLLVVDHVFEQPAWREACLAALADSSPWLVAVRCALPVLEERERRRGDRRLGLAAWQHLRVHDGAVYDVEVDTTAHSPAECAGQILAALASRGPFASGTGSTEQRAAGLR